MSFLNVQKEALELWAKIEGCDIPPDSLSHTSYSPSEWDTERLLSFAQVHDPSGFMVLLTLKGVYPSIINGKTVKLSELISGLSEKNQTLLDDVKKLSAILNKPDFLSELSRYTQDWLNRLSFFGDRYSEEDIQRGMLVSAIAAKAELNSLTHVVLRDGAFSSSGEDRRFNQMIYRFESADHVVDLLDDIPEGFCLGAIIPKHNSAYSYFALIFKSGQHVSVFSDQEKAQFPNQHEHRRNDRSQIDRINKSSLPYGILDFSVSGGDRFLQVLTQESNRHEVAKFNSLPVLAKMSDVDLHAAATLMNIFGLIYDDKDSLNNPERAGLSAQKLTAIACSKDSASIKNLPAAVGSIELPSFNSTSDVEHSNFKASQGENIRDYVNWNHWLEKLFKGRIQSDLVESGTSLLSLSAMTDDSFTTAKRFVADAHWLARENYASKLKEITKEDCKQNKEKLTQWIASRMLEAIRSRSNKQLLETFCSKQKIWATPSVHERSWLHINHRSHTTLNGIKFPTLNKLKSYSESELLVMLSNLDPPSFTTGAPSEYLAGTWRLFNKGFGSSIHPRDAQQAINERDEFGQFVCPLSGEVADRVAIEFTLKDPIAVSLATGVSVDDLPIRLKHFGRKGYNGNSILNRMDPVSEMQSPYDELSFDLTVYLSIEGIKKMAKEEFALKITNKILSEIARTGTYY